MVMECDPGQGQNWSCQSHVRRRSCCNTWGGRRGRKASLLEHPDRVSLAPMEVLPLLGPSCPLAFALQSWHRAQLLLERRWHQPSCTKQKNSKSL